LSFASLASRAAGLVCLLWALDRGPGPRGAPAFVARAGRAGPGLHRPACPAAPWSMAL